MERRGRATCVGIDQGQLATGGTRWSRRKAVAFKGGTSRISREAYVRSCERVCQEDAKAFCCTKDEGGPFGVAL